MEDLICRAGGIVVKIHGGCVVHTGSSEGGVDGDLGVCEYPFPAYGSGWLNVEYGELHEVGHACERFEGCAPVYGPTDVDGLES